MRTLYRAIPWKFVETQSRRLFTDRIFAGDWLQVSSNLGLANSQLSQLPSMFAHSQSRMHVRPVFSARSNDENKDGRGNRHTALRSDPRASWHHSTCWIWQHPNSQLGSWMELDPAKGTAIMLVHEIIKCMVK